MSAFPQELRDAASALSAARKANAAAEERPEESPDVLIERALAWDRLVMARMTFDAEMKKYMEAQRG